MNSRHGVIGLMRKLLVPTNEFLPDFEVFEFQLYNFRL